MAPRLLLQLGLLVKKNFILQMRRPIGALVELLLPCIFLGLISMVRLTSPVVDHCFSYFSPMDPGRFSQQYPDLSVIGMAPDTPYVRSIADEMVKQQDFISGYESKGYSQSDINEIIQSFDDDSLPFAQRISKMFTDYGFTGKEIAIMPTITSLQETLVQNSEFFRAAIEFNEVGDKVDYTLRMQSSIAREGAFRTDRDYPQYFRPGPESRRGYDQGWVALQQLIDRSILLHEGVDPLDIPVVAIRQMPYPVWQEDGFSNAIRYNLPLMIVISFLWIAASISKQLPYPVWQEDGFANAIRNSLPLMIVISFLWIGASISKELVGEKASRMKETMKMMGLANWVLWLSWVVQRLVLMIVTVILITMVMVLARYVIHTNALILFIFLLEYAITVMCFCFFLSTLFSKTTTAIAGTMLGYFLLYVPYFFLAAEFDNMSNNVRYMSCLLSSTCMGFGASIISKWETMEEGLQFGNVGTQTSDLDTFTMGDVMFMLFIDIIIYSLLTWYVEAVFPGEFGIKQKPWFFVTRDYWFGATKKPEQDGLELGDVNSDNLLSTGEHETGPRDKTAGISIKGLLKKFNTPKGKMTAVDGLSLDMYENQITSLLGHNGAGKTTTMSMLTGLFSPSGGDAMVNGHSILTSMDRVRESLGMCPQHNVLFDRLTVKEHLDFFIELKGYTGDVKSETKRMIEMLQLVDKKNAKADELSGGMKRKLSVAIAFAGGSKVVILDEPTAGMDPYARRATWDLILQNKKDRTILLTTHYMDEADLLGDRVAIMASGKLVCSGSSMFLKKRYGVGYHLTLVKSFGCDVTAVEKFIKSKVSSAQKISDVGAELVYILPKEEVDNFVPLFKKLEDSESSKDVNIDSFGLSLTTMEEVFMKVGEVTEENDVDAVPHQNGNGVNKENHKDPPDPNMSQFRVFKPSDLNSGAYLLAQQLKSMIIKRFINSKRYKKGLIVQLILPIIFAVLGLLVVMLTPESGSEPVRVMDLENYPGRDIEGLAYLGDFVGSSNYFSPTIKDYLNTAHLNTESLTAKVTTAKEKYNDAGFDCCAEPALQLATVCSDKGSSRPEWEACDAKDSWGYHACFDKCFIPKTPAMVEENCGKRPLPDTKYTTDDLSFFTNVFLDQINGDVRFYRKNQVALTYSTVPKFVKLIDPDNVSINYNDGSIVEYTLGTLDTDPSNEQHLLTGWFSHEGLHLAPAVQNVISNMLLVKDGKSTRIQTSNKPLPKSLLDRFDMSGANLQGSNLSILMLLGFSFLTSSFVLFIVEERENKSKHLQQISGVNGAVYWLGTLIWDLTNYLLCVFIVAIFFAIFNVQGYKDELIWAVFLLMLMYGFASIPFVYLCSLAFSSPVIAFATIAVLTFITGLAGFIANLILIFQRSSFQPTLEKILLFLPNFNFIQGLANIYSNGIRSEIWATCVEGTGSEETCRGLGLTQESVYRMGGGAIGNQLLAFFLIGVIALAVVLFLETYGKTLSLLFYQKLNTIKAADLELPEGEDDDVQAERTRIMCELQGLSKNNAVVCTNLRKKFGKVTAVQNLTLGIPKNECFGLLGVNGAGKTTTFSMLTGEVIPTGGEAFVAGFDLRKDIRKIQQRIGYCPQFDALIGIMTGRELLRMFANMRGIPETEIEVTVNETLRNLNLEENADKLCGSYSGGNKRKLSTAIALVGNPEVLFLDEPTAGMDPTTRRFLWTVLANLTAANIGSSIVLTSHSMEECEALCNRLVIMVNGSFKCLGGVQHLKSKYGEGYTITLTMPEEKQEECISFIEKTFSGAVLKEEHQGYLHYELSTDVKWSLIFELMENNKQILQLEDYAVNQTSLEQIFLNFAKDQTSEDANKTKKKRRCLCCWKADDSAVHDLDQHKDQRFSTVSVNRRASGTSKPAKV